MANRESKKCIFDPEAFSYILKYRKQSIIGIEKDEQFGYSAKTIHRAIKDRYISAPVLEKLALVLDVDTDYLTDGFKKYKELTGNYLPPQEHTYEKKLQREKISNEYLYNKMIEFILLTHNLLPQQLEALDEDTQRNFHLELERCIIKIIQKYFKTYVNDRILFEIESYYENKYKSESPEDKTDKVGTFELKSYITEDTNRWRIGHFDNCYDENYGVEIRPDSLEKQDNVETDELSEELKYKRIESQYKAISEKLEYYDSVLNSLNVLSENIKINEKENEDATNSTNVKNLFSKFPKMNRKK